MTEIFKLDVLALARQANPNTHEMPKGKLPFGKPDDPSKGYFSLIVPRRPWPLHLMDHFERNLLVEGRGKTPPGYRDSFLWRAEVTPGPVEVHLYDSAYCTYDGNRWNGIDHGEPGSNALDVEVGLPMWLRFETQYEIGDRLLAEHQAAHEAQMAREKKQREDASELLEMLFEFDDAEEWQMSDDGWANCEQGAEEGIYWCVRESFGSYWVRFENGWYVQKGEATDLPELRRVMKGMLAADKALDSELKVDE